MNAKEELMQYYRIERTSNNKIDDYMRAKERAEKITTTITGMPHGTLTSDKICDNVCEMVEIENEYKKILIDAELKKVNIIKKINMLER